MSSSFRSFHPVLQVIIILVVALVMTLVGTFLSILIAKFGLGIDNLANLPNMTSWNPAETEAMRITQAVTTLFLFIGTAYVTALLYDKPFADFYHFSVIKPAFLVAIALVIFFLSGPVISGLVDLGEKLGIATGKNNDELITKLLASNGFGMLIVNVLIFGLLPAVGEELVFRGMLQKFLINQTNMPWLGITLAALCFSLFHMEWDYFLPRWFMGMILGLMFYTSRSLWLPILAHFVNNSSAVVAYYLFQHHSSLVKENPLEQTTDFSTLELVGSIAFVIVACYAIYRYRLYSQNTLTKLEYPL